MRSTRGIGSRFRAGVLAVACALGCETTFLPPPRDGGADQDALDGTTMDATAGDERPAADAPAEASAQSPVPGCPGGTACDADGDGVRSVACGGSDCDDRDCQRFPGNAEVCDPGGHDEDCDPCTVAGVIDGDADRDGFVSDRCVNPWISADRAARCDPGRVATRAAAQTTAGADCNDDPAMRGSAQHPGLPEVCGNAVDDDCDGRPDFAERLFEDRDNDGRGNPAVMVSGMCRAGYVANGDDCDDARNETYLGAREMCDGLDNDCSLPGARAGGADPAEDGDGDHHSLASAMCLGRGEPGALGSAFPRDDCNDAVPTIYAGATEICGNGMDEDCDDVIDNPTQRICDDADGDGHGDRRTIQIIRSCAVPAGQVNEAHCDDCDDVSARRFPGNREVCDLLDNDCSTPDTALARDEDVDQDGFSSPRASCSGRGESGVPDDALPKTDCNDTNPDAHPEAVEVCDRVDRNCSSGGGIALDEDADNDGHATATATCLGFGEPDAPGSAFPKDDCDDTRASVHGGQAAASDTLTCNGVDEDCNPSTSELTRRDGCGTRGYCAVGGVCGRGPVVLEVSAGGYRTCARLGNGTVQCWGDIDLDGGSPDLANATPTPVMGLSGVVQIAAGGSYVCARLGDGTARCAGNNLWGQLGDGTLTNRASSVAAVGLSGVVGLAAGETHACALLADGTARCWGENESGALGDGTLVARLTPTLVRGLSGVAQIGIGEYHACARLTDGTVQCWGLNFQGVLGAGMVEQQLTPGPVPGLAGVVELAVGSRHTCARLADGTVRCWGSNNNGQLGDGTLTDRSTPVLVSGLSGVVELAVGGGHTCARSSDGMVRCWGSNVRGALGDGTTTTRRSPTPVTGLSGVVGIAAGADHTCAWLDVGTVRCWGNNNYGEVGDGTLTNRSNPVPVPGFPAVLQVAAGESYTCARLDNGTVRCWGSNDSFQLGDGSIDNHRLPSPVPGLSGVAEIVVNRAHTCARLNAGTIQCWGGNSDGQLGDGTTTTRPTPTTVTGLSGAVELVEGDSHTCARLGTGAVRCWGNNTYGQLGDATLTSRSAPTAVSGLSGVVELAAGALHTCARLGDNTVRCWGLNNDGELGDGTTANQRVPTPVAGLTGVVEITTGGSQTCARLTDGTVRCWGDNQYGQLGDGTRENRLDPTPVRGLSGVVELAAGANFTCARLGGGAVHCWGDNQYGQLGTGTTTTDRPTAGPVTGLTGAVGLTAGSGHACARLGDGAVRCWGSNDVGQLGDGTLDNRLTPALISDL